MRAKEHDGRALRYITVEPDGYSDGDRYPLVVLLHGFGSHMGDLASLAPAIDSTGYLYAFPNAPHPLDIGYGATGFAWASFPPRENDTGIADSIRRLDAFITEVMDQLDVADGHVVLGGFSQGATMTLRAGLRSPERFAGLAVLSGNLPDADALDGLPDNPGQAVFIAHGGEDTMISVKEGRRSRDFLKERGYAPEYHEYPMGHEIGPDEIADLTRWLHSALPPAM
jgi:phospholipase/carboxylesterase